MHWQIHKDRRNHYQSGRRGERLPVAMPSGVRPP